MDFDETVQYLYDLQKFGTKLGLDKTRELLRLLGRPDKGGRYLHVTGTNGKGSVCAMAASVLTAAGHRTGLYTSPHLVSFTERFKMDGAEASRKDVVELAARLRRIVDAEAPELKPTFFEFTTAMAFDYFAIKKADAVVLEVGMGGRLDSTNVIEPLCTAITNVEMEHAEYLGDTIMDVAYEKAGIIKPGVPLVTAEKKPEVVSYLKQRCADAGSAMYQLGRDFNVLPGPVSLGPGGYRQEFDYDGPGGTLNGLSIRLAGKHQAENAAVAICSLRLMSGQGLTVGDDNIRDGLARASWDGRLEIVSERPLVVLDGAHNPASVKSLVEAVRRDFAGAYKRLVLVVGVLDDKDLSGMLGMLMPIADEVVFTSAAYERAVPPARLLEAVPAYSGGVLFGGTVADALRIAVGRAGADDMVLVAGSLYVVGEAKAFLAGSELFLRA
jgi:dihydrofolate synthase / folylpolyglutamate synthase